MSIGTQSLPSSRIHLYFGARPGAPFTGAQNLRRTDTRYPRVGILVCLAFCTVFWGSLAAILVG